MREQHRELHSELVTSLSRDAHTTPTSLRTGSNTLIPCKPLAKARLDRNITAVGFRHGSFAGDHKGSHDQQVVKIDEHRHRRRWLWVNRVAVPLIVLSLVNLPWLLAQEGLRWLDVAYLALLLVSVGALAYLWLDSPSHLAHKEKDVEQRYKRRPQVTGKEHSIFISYAGPDRARAEWVASTLTAAGHDALLDLWDIHLGDRWDQRIQEGLKRAFVVVAIYSPAYFSGASPTLEFSNLLASGRRLIALAFDPKATKSIPPSLRSVACLDLGRADEATAVARLLQAVNEHRQDEAGSESSPSPDPADTDHDGPSRLGAAPALARISAPRLPTDELPGVWNVNAERPEVTGRDPLITQIRGELVERGATVLQPLHGLDGVGSRELAQEYAYRFASQYDLVWWVDSVEVETIRSDFTHLAHKLTAPLTRTRIDTPGDVEAMFARLGKRRWLVILADADAPEVVGPWIPSRNGSGHILITTRSEAWLKQGSPYLQGSASGATLKVRRAAYRKQPQSQPCVLAVATEWKSGKGGVSTFNRQLCLALADAGAKVFCLLPQAGLETRNAARRRGVTLLEAAQLPAWSEDHALYRKPALRAADYPDIIVGHGRITGRAAQLLAEDHYPAAKRLHVIHMASDEIEWFKEREDDAGERVDAGERADLLRRIEVQLGGTAHSSIAVGPRLEARFQTDLHAAKAAKPLRLDPGFDTAEMEDLEPPPGEPCRVLVFGRAEDSQLKGLDLAARALGLVARRREVATPELLVRGAPEKQCRKLREELLRQADSPTLGIVVRPYSTDADELAADLRSASLVLMPSRAEGFGLSGAEAITAGAPVLLSSASGLATLLTESLGPEPAERFVVKTYDVPEDSERWSQAIETVLMDRGAAFRRASELRDHLARTYTWSAAAAKLLAEIG
ncbi:TIR domain-containing protein [Streptomyces xantholiticus]